MSSIQLINTIGFHIQIVEARQNSSTTRAKFYQETVRDRYVIVPKCVHVIVPKNVHGPNFCIAPLTPEASTALYLENFDELKCMLLHCTGATCSRGWDVQVIHELDHPGASKRICTLESLKCFTAYSPSQERATPPCTPEIIYSVSIIHPPGECTIMWIVERPVSHVNQF